LDRNLKGIREDDSEALGKFMELMESVKKHLEMVFHRFLEQGKISIKVTFKPNSQGQNRKKAYQFTTSRNDTRAAGDTSIRDGNSLKSFLTYKHLLGVHHLKKDDFINLFDLLVKGVLKHFKYSLTHGKELGELWAEVEKLIGRTTDRRYPINKKKADVNSAVKAFNEAFGERYAQTKTIRALKTPWLKLKSNTRGRPLKSHTFS
jgi:hypothetical protein